MKRHAVWAGLAAVACGPGDVPPLPDVSFERPTCLPDEDNALRASCSGSRDGTGPVHVELFAPNEGSPRVFEGDPDATEVSIPLWDLVGLTGYDYALVDRGEVIAEGTFVTPPTPDAFVPVVTPIVDGPSAIDRVLLPLRCGEGPALLVLDGEGRTRWYQEVDGSGEVTGMGRTDRGTFVAISGRSRVSEWDTAGNALTSVSLGSGLPLSVHHMLDTADGVAYALDTTPTDYPDGKTYLVDGITEVVLGARTGTHVWDVAEILDPMGLLGGDPIYWLGQFPGAIDFGHENGIAVLPDEDDPDAIDWLLTFKHLDAIVRVDARSGDAEWVVEGAPHDDAAWQAPILPVTACCGADPTFVHPHHPTPSDWGTFLVIDNGDGTVNSQVLDLAVDPVAGTAEIRAQWDLGVICPVQGSVFPLPDGSVLAVCARTGELFELDGTGIRRRVQIACSDREGPASIVGAEPFASGDPP